jgi:hypothetical protein
MTHLKTLLATAAVSLLCALPAYSQTIDATSALSAIASDCARQWGTDFHMQLVCRQEQTEAYYKLNPPVQAPPQAEFAKAPPTLPPAQLEPLSWRLAQINQLMRQSLPTIIRHCGPDAACRKEETAAVHALAAMEIVAAKAIRDPTTYTTAVATNDTINACLVMWRASESFASAMKCITDATPTM